MSRDGGMRRGNSRGEGGRGGRGGRGRGRGGQGGGYRNGGGRRRGRRQMPAAESGNQRERIAIESGFLVLIDQFMMANPQFLQRLAETQDDPMEVRDEVIREFGGQVVELEPGTYRIERDPYKYTIVIHPEGERPSRDELMEQAQESSGYVFVDTRCLAMIDRELLDDQSLLERYMQLWRSGEDKACRDLLRDNGGAVRYGFGRYGDELGVYVLPEEQVVCLWPDVANQESGAEPEAGEQASA